MAKVENFKCNNCGETEGVINGICPSCGPTQTTPVSEEAKQEAGFYVAQAEIDARNASNNDSQEEVIEGEIEE